MKTNYSIFSSILFIVSLVLLLANDLVLKEAYPSWITGKLSDFAGLILFPLFFSAFFTTKAKAIHIATAIAFVIWKSPISQPLIDLINMNGLLNFGRVVDYTDLLALAVLPISYNYFKIERTSNHRVFQLAVIGIATFGICGTGYSQYTYYHFDEISFSYQMSFPIDQIKNKLKKGLVFDEDSTSNYRMRYSRHRVVYDSVLTKSSHSTYLRIGLTIENSDDRYNDSILKTKEIDVVDIEEFEINNVFLIDLELINNGSSTEIVVRRIKGRFYCSYCPDQEIDGNPKALLNSILITPLSKELENAKY
jgi:hypothetical protein